MVHAHAPQSRLSNAFASGLGSDSTWQRVQTVLADCALSTGRPMVHSSSKRENPFGASLFFAYSGMLFEVLKNGYVASVTLFSE